MKKLFASVLATAFVFSIATTAFAATAGTGVDPTEGYPGSANYSPAPPESGDYYDNFIGNANETGKNIEINDGSSFNDVVKSHNMKMNDPTSTQTYQRTHGEYQNNTNSCASCHQTHTAAAKDLLFKNSVYDTCTACHDGTLGFYNVFAKGNMASTAGTFGGDLAGNASIHLAMGEALNGAMSSPNPSIYDYVWTGMAPGGNNIANPFIAGSGDRRADILDDAKGILASAWKQPFDCAACHAPHGSYSDRILAYNPNDMANTDMKQGGNKLVNYAVYADATILNANVDGAPDYVVLKTTKGALAGQKTAQNWSSVAKFDATKGMDKLAATDQVIVVMRKAPLDANGDLKQDKVSGIAQFTYLRDLTPWLYGSSYNPYPTKVYFTRFTDIATTDPAAKSVEYKYDASTKTVVTKFEKEYGNAFATGDATAMSSINYADIALCYVVKLHGDVVRKDANSVPYVTTVDFAARTPIYTGAGVDWTKVNPDIYDEASTGVEGYGVMIGKYCATCHTDYRAQSAGGRGYDSGSGMYTVAYRHDTSNDRYTCLKCHYAHGTDSSVMLDALDYTVDDLQAATTTVVGQKVDGLNGLVDAYGKGWDATSANDYMVDKNGSSALKRYTNMAVCWKCHTDSKSTQIKNNESYWNNNDAPHGGTSGIKTSTQYGW